VRDNSLELVVCVIPDVDNHLCHICNFVCVGGDIHHLVVLKMTTLVAIDPGVNGGIACHWPGCKVWAIKMPATDGDLVKLFHCIIDKFSDSKTVFYLEDLVKFSKNPRPESVVTTYAANCGSLKGMIQYSASVLHLVRAQTWLKALSLGSKGDRSQTQWKNHLKAHAQRTFPHLDVTLATSDALCILHYAEQLNKEFTGL